MFEGSDTRGGCSCSASKPSRLRAVRLAGGLALAGLARRYGLALEGVSFLEANPEILHSRIAVVLTTPLGVSTMEIWP